MKLQTALKTSSVPLLKLVPLQLLEKLYELPSNRWADRLVRASLRDRNVTLTHGVGKGLKFNGGNSNPDYAFGTYELPVQNVLARYLQPGDIFYDIGANFGFFTAIAARLVGPSGRVYAFEPEWHNTRRIRVNLELNHLSNVSVLEKAVSCKSGTGKLLLTHYPGGHTLSTVMAPPDVTATMAIETIAIDDAIENLEIDPPTLVKIDVEGAELDVLYGMADTLKIFRPIVIYEIDDERQEGVLEKRCVLDDFVSHFNYEILTLEAAYPGLKWQVAHAIALPK
jgi:FkbM family methyltransferase